MLRWCLFANYVILFLLSQPIEALSSQRSSRQINFDSSADEFVGRGLLKSSSQGMKFWHRKINFTWTFFLPSETGSIASQAEINIISITGNQLDEESSRAYNRIDDIIHFEEILLDSEIRVQPNTPSFSHLKIFKPTTDAKQLAQEALLVIEATRQLQQR